MPATQSSTFARFASIVPRRLQWYYALDPSAGFVNQVLAVDRDGISHIWANSIDEGVTEADLPEGAIEVDGVSP
jgi:hypothetical protein